MPTFHRLPYSVRDGATIGQTVEAADANEAVRHVAAAVCDLTLPEVDRALAHRESPVLDTPERIADVLREPNRLYAVEHFQVLCLNTRRRLIAVENIGQGILDQVLVHAREVFAVAIAKRASAIVRAHNLCAAAHKLCEMICATAPSKMPPRNTSRG